MTETINSIAAPKKGTNIAEYRTKVGSSGKDTAVIDFNSDGKLNYGKKEGDTIKIFDWDKKTATGHHLVKKGELGLYGCAPAGQVDTTTMTLGKSLLKTFNGRSQAEIKKMSPNAILIHPQGKDKFEEGATLIFKSADGSRHNVHFVKSGEPRSTILKMTGAKDLTEVKSDGGVMAGYLAWTNIPAKK